MTNSFFFFFDYDYDDDDDDDVGSRRRCGRPRRCNWHCLGLWGVFLFYFFLYTLLMTNFFFFFFDYDYDDDDDDYIGSRRRCGRPRRCNWHCLGLWESGMYQLSLLARR